VQRLSRTATAALMSCVLEMFLARSSPALPAADLRDRVGGLVIRVYDQVGLDASELRDACAIADEILASARVHAAWHDCTSRESQDPLPACGQPLAPDELIVRIGPGGGMVPAAVLGQADIGDGARRGVLATVYVDHVHILADRTHAGRALMTARTMAHEIGHLLMGKRGHSPAGLMRARWLDAEVQRDVPEDWTWLASDVTLIAHRIASHGPAAVTPGRPVGGSVPGRGRRDVHFVGARHLHHGAVALGHSFQVR
jgi:hypothetical protein